MKILSEADLSGNKIINLADPTADSDAATRGWAKARANHTGTQSASTISDFDTQVRTNRLDQMAIPTADVSINSNKLTNVAAGVATTDAVNKAQLDAAIQGVSSKQVADMATIAALPTCTYGNGSSGVGATLTATGNGALSSIDSVTPVASMVILVKNQATGLQNGLYTVTQVGNGSTPWILTRASTMDLASEMNALVAVKSGTTLSNSLWLSAASSSFVVGTTSLSFVQLNSSTAATEGDGITIVGNQISVDVGTGIVIDGSSKVAIDTSVVVRKYSTSVGNGSSTSIAVTHNLGTRDVVVSVRQVASPYAVVLVDNEATDTNTVTVKFAAAPSSNQYRVTVTG